jgi:uncharacterized membrane protein YgcG
MPRRLTLVVALAVIALFLSGHAGQARAQTGWTITSFAVTYNIDTSGGVNVTEDILVDFGSEHHHGIFRDMPVRYGYDDKHDRKIDVTNIDVRDAGGNPVRFDTSSSGPNLRLTIGNPDVLVSGRQEYKISYLLTGALNPFADHDEFFWNVTGNGWEASIEEAGARVVAPTNQAHPNPIEKVDCFQGETGATDRCLTSEISSGHLGTAEGLAPLTAGPEANFQSRGTLLPGEGMTIVVGIEKGAVAVAPPVLVAKLKSKTFGDYFDVTPLTVGVMAVLLLGLLAAIARLWWVQGRDRWLGDMFYLNEAPATPSAESTKPLLAHETIVVEFTPPELDAKTKRRLRPAEIGVLLDERADTLDVTATIVDLAVRKHMVIKETKSGGVVGLFKKKDYELTRLTTDAGDLLPYETQLKDALFDTGDTVTLSSLKNKFHDDLAKVKAALYKQTLEDKLFPRNPETVRNVIRIAGVAVGALGGAMAYGFGALFGGGLIGVPFIFAGVLLLFTASAFPRRTGNGRVLFRRSLGFRRFMVESDKAREKFAENANLFHDYLPYAIVYGCVDRWAKVFKDLGLDPGTPTYYVGAGPFIAASFADSMTSFSSSISSTMASTPGGSGGSGFGGGSGGGGGGGGGGAW